MTVTAERQSELNCLRMTSLQSIITIITSAVTNLHLSNNTDDASLPVRQ